MKTQMSVLVLCPECKRYMRLVLHKDAPGYEYMSCDSTNCKNSGARYKPPMIEIEAIP